MNESEQLRLTRAGFNEILAGYSPLPFEGDTIFLKHFGSRDQIEVDQVHKVQFDKVHARGIPTSEEKAKELHDNQLWTEDDEKNMTVKREEAEALRKGLQLLFKKSDRDAQKVNIDKAEKEFLELLIHKNNLFGKTAEFFANKRVTDYCVVHSLFRDREFKVPYFGKENLYDLDDEMMEKMTDMYNRAMIKFDEVNIKRIALSNAFLNYYLLSKSPYEFYGMAIAKLTYYQVHLAMFADHYKPIIFNAQNPPPQELIHDPEKLDDWISGSNHARKVMESTLGEKSEGEGATFTTIVGANKEDLEYVGVEQTKGDTVSLNQKVRENGGHMTKADLMKLMGIG